MSNYDKYRSEDEHSEYNLSGTIGKNKKKSYNKYKTPYKVLCVNQLKQKDRGEFEKS